MIGALQKVPGADGTDLFATSHEAKLPESESNVDVKTETNCVNQLAGLFCFDE